MSQLWLVLIVILVKWMPSQPDEVEEALYFLRFWRVERAHAAMTISKIEEDRLILDDIRAALRARTVVEWAGHEHLIKNAAVKKRAIGKKLQELA